MRPVYSLVLDLVPRPPDTPARLFPRLVELALDWVAEGYPDDGFRPTADGVTVAPLPGHVVVAATDCIDPAHDRFTLDWSQPDPDLAVRQACRVELARTPLGLQARVAVQAGSADGALAPVRADVGRPGVLDAWLGVADGLVGGQPIPDAVRRLTPPFVPGFVDGLLLEPGRVLPVVVLSPLPQTGRPLVDPERVLDEVFGLAHVVELVTRDATFKLTDRVGDKWSCFNGAVRLYWPRVDLGSDFRRHPIFFPDHYPPGPEADDRLPRDILRRVAAAAHGRFTDAPLVRQAEAARDARRQAGVQERLAALTADAAQAAEWMVELERAWEENKRLAARLAAADALLAEVQSELTDHRDQWATVHEQIADAQAAADRERAAADRYRRRAVDGIRRVADALDLARDDFADVLVVLPDAARSAADSPYQYPRKVYDLFAALADAMRAMRQAGQLGEPLFDRLRRAGFEYKDRISQTSATRFADEYTFVYAGQKRLFENHVTLGSGFNPQECLSVHWLRDDIARRFVVGWCGKHRTNTRT